LLRSGPQREFGSRANHGSARPSTGRTFESGRRWPAYQSHPPGVFSVFPGPFGPQLCSWASLILARIRSASVSPVRRAAGNSAVPFGPNMPHRRVGHPGLAFGPCLARPRLESRLVARLRRPHHTPRCGAGHGRSPAVTSRRLASTHRFRDRLSLSEAVPRLDARAPRVVKLSITIASRPLIMTRGNIFTAERTQVSLARPLAAKTPTPTNHCAISLGARRRQQARHLDAVGGIDVINTHRGLRHCERRCRRSDQPTTLGAASDGRIEFEKPGAFFTAGRASSRPTNLSWLAVTRKR